MFGGGSAARVKHPQDNAHRRRDFGGDTSVIAAVGGCAERSPYCWITLTSPGLAPRNSGTGFSQSPRNQRVAEYHSLYL
jgi:hypothetical protein